MTTIWWPDSCQHNPKTWNQAENEPIPFYKFRLCLVYRDLRKLLRLYPDKIETWNRDEIPFTLRIIPWSLSVAKAPKTAFQNIAHL